MPRHHPRLLLHALAVLGAGLLLLLGPLAPSVSASASTPVPGFDATFTSLLNTLRGTLGLGTLVVDSQLSGIAEAWSAQMAGSGVLSHNPGLTSQATSWSKVGENVGTGDAVIQVFNALVASPSHMHNMSDPAFTRIGVGTVTDATGRLWTTHVFARPRSAGAADIVPRPPAPVPASAPAPPSTRAPRPKPAPVAAPPTTSATVLRAEAPVSVPQTAAPDPGQVAAAATATTSGAPGPASPAMTAVSSSRQGRNPLLLLGTVAIVLAALGGTGFLVRRVSASGA